MRPKQWTKNLLCLAAVIFANRLNNLTDIVLSLAAVVIFCGLSGTVYLLNDLSDIERDRAHPFKRRRPLASGALSPAVARAALAIVGVASLASGFAIRPLFGVIAVSYIVLNLAYSYKLKHIVLVDVFGLASFYLLRAAAGAAIIQVDFSQWLYLVTLLGALFIGLGKRRHELIVLEGKSLAHRPILAQYTAEFLEELISITASAILISYALYTFFAQQQHRMMLTIPFAIYGIFRYLYLIHLKNDGGAPEEILLHDTPLLVDILLWVGTTMVLLYAVH